uniref:Large ribosomal subunit protein eL13 n=3 Tax=Canis lupus TaxID=9612 RepID=A0A8P0PE82_CANLF
LASSHNGMILKPHFHKNQQLCMATWFNQPTKKISRYKAWQVQTNPIALHSFNQDLSGRS